MTRLLIDATWGGIEYRAGDEVDDALAEGVHLMANLFGNAEYRRAALAWTAGTVSE